MWGAIITGILSLAAKLLGWFTKKDERDVSHDQGERLGVAETQAASAGAAVREAKDAARTEDGVARLPDSVLDDELRDGPK